MISRRPGSRWRAVPPSCQCSTHKIFGGQLLRSKSRIFGAFRFRDQSPICPTSISSKNLQAGEAGPDVLDVASTTVTCQQDNPRTKRVPTCGIGSTQNFNQPVLPRWRLKTSPPSVDVNSIHRPAKARDDNRNPNKVGRRSLRTAIVTQRT